MTAGKTIQDQWYARRNGVVRGPFPGESVSRHILLGRIRMNDELSTDGNYWLPVVEYPQLLPPELTGLSGWEGYQALVMARIRYDERVAERRRNAGGPPDGCERRTPLPDRRRAGSNRDFFRFLMSGRHSGRQQMKVFLVTALLVSLVVVYISLSMR